MRVVSSWAKIPAAADQTAGAARFKSLAAGTFFLPQQGPEGFMFFNTIHQLGSCLPISSQIGKFCKSPFLPMPPSQADPCTHRSNVQCCSEAAKALHTHSHKSRKPQRAIVMNCCGLFCTGSLKSFTWTTRCSSAIKQESFDLDSGWCGLVCEGCRPSSFRPSRGALQKTRM